MDDITSVLMLLSGWIPAMILIAFLIINKKMRFGFFQGFKKKFPIIDFIHPTSQRTKSVIARFNPENEKSRDSSFFQLSIVTSILMYH